MSHFTGPLFIVGLPRSGTKLVRDLMNRNRKIGINTVESQFVPMFINRFGERPPFESPASLDEFYRLFSGSIFYRNHERRGRTMARQELENISDKTSWAAIFEFIFRYYAPGGCEPGFIWGDKTPAYVRKMCFLKKYFPEARFVHIIRDPRDYSLSVKRSWGKSIYRAATLWHDQMRLARSQGNQLGGDYFEVSYEALLADTESTLRGICDYLDCIFTPDMLSLAESRELRGDAKGKTEVVTGNRQKYRKHLRTGQIRRIEEIVYPMADACGYKFDHAQSYRPLPALQLRMLKWYDGYASLKMHVAHKGLRKGLSYSLRLHQEKSASAS